MKARLTSGLAGVTNRDIGHIVEGEEARRLCEAGLAVPVREEPEIETADAPKAPEKAIRKHKAKN